MKVEIDKLPIFTTSDKMKIGQVAIITEHGNYTDAVLLCMHDGFVNLANPQQVWFDRSVAFKVRILQPGTEIKLTVEV